MMNVIGKVITGKVVWVAAGVAVALLAVIGGLSWGLTHYIGKAAKAEAVAAQLRSDLEGQVAETRKANRRYELLDLRFSELEAKKQEIRTVRKVERIYIEKAAENDEAVEKYLGTDIPSGINCLLSESCDDNGVGANSAASEHD